MSTSKEVLFAGLGGLSLVLAPEILPFVLIIAGILLLYFHID